VGDGDAGNIFEFSVQKYIRNKHFSSWAKIFVHQCYVFIYFYLVICVCVCVHANNSFITVVGLHVWKCANVVQVFICGFGLRSVTRNEYNSTLKDKPRAGESYLILAPDNWLSITVNKHVGLAIIRQTNLTFSEPCLVIHVQYVRKTNKMRTFLNNLSEINYLRKRVHLVSLFHVRQTNFGVYL
jgi:hypothetical protein